MLWIRSLKWPTQPKPSIVHDVVTEAPVSGFPFGGHLHEHRFVPIDVVVDDHFALGGMQSVKPAGILRERSAPRDRQGQEQRVKTSIIEAFAKITTGSDKQSFLITRDRRQRLRCRS